MINMFMPMIKAQAPRLERELNQKVEALIDETAQKNKVAPFDLHIVIVKEDDKAVGNIKQGIKEIEKIDVGALVKELFQNELKTLPKMAQNWVMGQLGNDTVDGFILGLLEEGCLLIKYNEDDQLESYKIVKGKEDERINLTDFFNSL